jgi:hypothetical protein
MRTKRAALLAAIFLAMAGCSVPLAPKWNVDVFFPIRYPDVQLSQYAGPGGVIPPVTITFTTPADSDNVSDATRQVFDQDIDTLKAKVILVNTADLTGSLTVSIAAVKSNLFSANPNLAVTVTMPLRVTAGDTIPVTVNTTLFKSAQKLYTQTSGSMRASNTSIVVTPSDKLQLGVDLTANIKFSK